MYRALVIFAVVLPLMLAIPAGAQTWKGPLDDQGRQHGAQALWDGGDTYAMERAEFSHGVRHGKSNTFYPSLYVATEANYRDGALQGSYTEYADADGKVVLKQGHYKNGQMDGDWTEYYPNSELRIVQSYLRGQLNGKRTIYFNAAAGDGRAIAEIATYKNGRASGAYERRFENDANSVEEKGELVKGVKMGLWERFYSNGNPQSRIEHYADVPHGRTERFYQSGLPLAVTQFNHGIQEGEYTEYHETEGRVVRVFGQYLDGKTHGTWFEYSMDSVTIKATRYRLGVIEGSLILMHEFDGTIDSHATYKNGQLDGPYIKYHVPGPVMTEDNSSLTPAGQPAVDMELGSHKAGIRVERWTWRYPSGKLKTQGDYDDNGRKTGTWLHYDVLEEVARIEVFEAGQLVDSVADCRSEVERCNALK